MWNRNVGKKERLVRLVGGVLIIACGLIVFGITPLGLGTAAVGAVTLITGVIQYCPACALAGRSAEHR